MTEWVNEYWWLVALCVAAAVSVLNLITKHYSQERPGLKRALLFVTELLSVLVSAGARVGEGPAGKLKLPLQSVPPRS